MSSDFFMSGGSGGSIWSGLGSATGNLILSNAGFTTEFDQTSNIPWLWANTTAATVSTTNASPLLEVAANYWTGSASAQDLWSIGSSLAAGANGASTLTIAHSGSAGTVSVSVPRVTTTSGGSGVALAVGVNGNNGLFVDAQSNLRLCGNSNASAYITSGGILVSGFGSPIGFASSNGAADTGISRLAAGILGVGNGTASDWTGGIRAAKVYISRSNSTNYDFAIDANLIGINIANNLNFSWSSTTNSSAAADTNLSRISAGVVAVGTGANGSIAGTLKAAVGVFSNGGSALQLPTVNSSIVFGSNNTNPTGIIQWNNSSAATKIGIGANEYTTADFEIFSTGLATAGDIAVFGHATGNLTLPVGSFIQSTTQSPTSAATAGVTGQIAWDSGKVYVCTAGGAAGSATWKASTLTAV